MQNCIYDDGSVISMSAGPCALVNDAGNALVGVDVQEDSVDVVAAPSFPIAGVVIVAALLLLGGR